MAMNREVLEKALVLIESSSRFGMETVLAYEVTGFEEAEFYCGTPGCIAGHILAAAGKLDAGSPVEDMDRQRDAHLCELARDAAGLPRRAEDHHMVDAIDDLFGPCGPRFRYDYRAQQDEPGYITKEHAARCLRKFIDTGIVDWNGTAEEGGSDE